MAILLKAISDSDTVLMISADALLPQDHGLIQIGDEQITYDNIYMGTVYGCIRGINSTSAASHNINSPVVLVDYYHAPTSGSATETYLSVFVDDNSTTIADNGNWTNFLALELAAGNWDVSGSFAFVLNDGVPLTVNYCLSDISGGEQTPFNNNGDTALSTFPPTATSYSSGSINPRRFTLSETTTLYAKAYVTGNTPASIIPFGRVSATKVS